MLKELAELYKMSESGVVKELIQAAHNYNFSNTNTKEENNENK